MIAVVVGFLSMTVWGTVAWVPNPLVTANNYPSTFLVHTAFLRKETVVQMIDIPDPETSEDDHNHEDSNVARAAKALYGILYGIETEGDDNDPGACCGQGNATERLWHVTDCIRERKRRERNQIRLLETKNSNLQHNIQMWMKEIDFIRLARWVFIRYIEGDDSLSNMTFFTHHDGFLSKPFANLESELGAERRIFNSKLSKYGFRLNDGNASITELGNYTRLQIHRLETREEIDGLGDVAGRIQSGFANTNSAEGASSYNENEYYGQIRASKDAMVFRQKQDEDILVLENSIEDAKQEIHFNGLRRACMSLASHCFVSAFKDGSLQDIYITNLCDDFTTAMVRELYNEQENGAGEKTNSLTSFLQEALKLHGLRLIRVHYEGYYRHYDTTRKYQVTLDYLPESIEEQMNVDVNE